MSYLSHDNVVRIFRTVLNSSVAVSAICLPSYAIAQDTGLSGETVQEDVEVRPQGNPTVEPAASGNEIVVSGIRDSLENAMNIRRNADVILDGISADDIGSTPDLNLGEALQRIPGVQINREGARRDATISVRGLPGRFTKTTVMGQSIASTTRGSNTGNPFGIFESGIFNGANVIKSFTADNLSGGLAAQVDLRIKSALERKESLVARAEVGYEETTEDFNPSFFVSGTKHLSDRFGVYGTVSYSKQSFRRDTFRVNNYTAFSNTQLASLADGTLASGIGDTVSATPNPAFDIPASGANGLSNSVIYPSAVRQFVQTNAGYRVSGGAGMAYEINDNASFRLDGIYTRRDLKDANQDLFIVDPNPTQSLISPLSSPISIGVVDFDDNGTEENVFLTPRVLISDQQTAIGNRSFPSLDEAWSLYPQFNYENDEVRFNVTGTYSEATGSSILSQYDVRVRQRGGALNDANGDGIDDRGTGQVGVIDTGSGNLGDILVNNVVPNALLQLQDGIGGWSLEPSTIGARTFIPIMAPDGTTFDSPVSVLVAGFNEGVKRDLVAFDFEAARKFENSIVTEVGVGGYVSSENADRFRAENSALGLNISNLTSDIYKLSDGVSRGGKFLGGKIRGVELDQFLSINIPVIESQLGTPTRMLPDGVTWNPTAANLANFFPELTPESAATVSVDEILEALPAVPETGYLQRLALRNTIDDNYSTKRDTLELFAMMKFNFAEAIGAELRGNLGGRFVRSELSGSVSPVSKQFYDNLAALRASNGGDTLVFRDGAVLEYAKEKNEFERFLPSVNVIYEITPDIIVRGAYYHTFEALDLAEFSPTPTLIQEIAPGGDPDESDLPAIVGSNGQPIPSTIVNVSGLDINPRRSEAFDLGISWYNRPGGVISLGFFRKSLIDDISRFRNFCPEGENFTVEGQTFNDLRTADVNSSNPIEASYAGRCVFTNDNGDPQRIRIDLSQNNPDTINVTGFEAQIQQRLDFLPGLFKNTGFVANYTRVRSGGDNDVQLYNVAEDTFNIIGYYEDDLFQARLAYNNQSEIQQSGGSSFSGGATRVAPRDQLDFSGAIKPFDNFEVRFEVFNITNSARREYIQFEELIRVYEYDGRTYAMSVTHTF